MQPLESTRGRLNKRPRVNIPPPRSFHIHSPTENSSPSSDRYRKRVRKSSQLPQFEVYEDEILGADSPNLGAQKNYSNLN
jgi:hypothetical protein